jgi:hypothetical protein
MGKACPNCRKEIPPDTKVNLFKDESSGEPQYNAEMTCPNCGAELMIVGEGLVPKGSRPAPAPVAEESGSADTSHLKSTSGFSGKEIAILLLVGLGIIGIVIVLKILNVF